MSLPASGLTPVEDFHELRRAVDDRLAAKGLPTSKFANSTLESAQIDADDIAELKEHMAKLMALEGRRNFWLGFATNSFFFVLGILAAKL